ncbi:HAD family hydrolase [Brevibacillus sp. NRS-1366]|uniref:HAD family hydrolase n=1 Tax=Brevibacillus sp. NRS-1366 TaxID=3233899 RepID=UPI003D1934F9
MSKRWVTFDLDGTLMQNPFGAWVFPEIADVVSGRVGRTFDIVAEMVAEHEARMEQGRYVEAYDWDNILELQCKQLGMEESFEIEPLLRKHAVAPKISLLEPGILEVLSEIKIRGFALAVVTNGFYKFQAPVMEALGLLHHFDEILTPERVGTGKPDPGMIQVLSGEVVAHVGDRLDHDVQMANRRNVTSVFIDRNLPVELKELGARIRSSDQRMITRCLEKWRKECRNTSVYVLPSVFLPAVVIHSMQELVLILDESKGG